ncbi:MULTISPECIES: exostosin family protein [unclassified Synechococcus]|uniref:exostosin family protein n=1 Tax=unclassified Synechococcus TaxID=2626047 RepID=UPI00140DE32B|nr:MULTISPECIES: exostosin family protein [unclassified Synechococcus]
MSAFTSTEDLHLLEDSDHIYLVESGLNRLRKAVSNDELFLHDRSRQIRLGLLNFDKLTVIHLSDEEGFDGDTFYSLIPQSVPIFRNFYHTRFSNQSNITTFPIGPRNIFLPPSHSEFSSNSLQRTYPWSFMGTLWPSGSRTLAVSTFLRTLPHGYYFGGESFASGLPLSEYRQILLNSDFALAPEGDRHLDTFRLWESFSCGCIPIVVDFNDTVTSLLPNYPLPTYSSWARALDHVLETFTVPSIIQDMHFQSQYWWHQYMISLRHSFFNPP